MRTAIGRRLAFAAAGITLALFTIPGPATAAERVYYVAAEETAWDYAPAGRNVMMGRPFDDDESVFVERTPATVGGTYVKALYRQYADADFTTPLPRPEAWAHLGFLGPVLHAEVGDTIRVHFKNNASRPFTMHPHGVFYDKASEGAPYADGTAGADKADDAVPPGATHTYVWEVPERAGPGPNDPSSIAWLYHSHVDAVRDSNAGLVGAIVVTAQGQATADGAPRDIDREFVTLFTVTDENQSWYLDRNIETFADPAHVDPNDEAFQESNLMHGINGYIYGNLPGLKMNAGERTRWYTLALGTEVDLHTPHWHGNTGLSDGRRVDVVDLLPASSRVVDVTPDSQGVWMFHCHVNDHIAAGMTALYEVGAGDSAEPAD
ncbi:MAG: multicopper oxidase domain-containing protein [Alphaproteobacteria bacterium]|nr:multicopper oxidase domain-containing protein [Alphaproteobacteria bacterium]